VKIFVRRDVGFAGGAGPDAASLSAVGTLANAAIHPTVSDIACD
jgi:hypothetical protein